MYVSLRIVLVAFSLFFSGLTYGQFAGGSGTEEDPWQVATFEHLNDVRNYLGEDHADKHFIQTADINMTGSYWEPIGSSGSRFMGTYHGDDYKISNLNIYRPDYNYNGLFGYLENARISNVNLENVDVTGWGLTGSLAGHARYSSVSFITVTGDIEGFNDNIGGVIGSEVGGELNHLSADVSVIGRSNIGGVFGWVKGQVRYAHSTGTVSGTSQNIGGFAGIVDWDGEVSDSFSTADVTGDNRVGGFAGRINISYGFSGSVYRVFSAGAVTGVEDVGGLIGMNSGTVIHSYWDTESSGQETSGADSGVTGKTTAEMQQQATFAPFNFYSAWQIDEGNGYPEFQDCSMHALPEEIDLSELTGSGTEQDPYLINNSNELNAIRQDLEAHYKLNSDLDVTATVIWNHGRGWEPLGNQDNRFTGVFDGNGKTITGLATNRPLADDQAFFGYTDEAQIKDLHILNAQIYGSSYSGSLAGRAGNSSVSFITVTGNIVGTANHIGGIIGFEGGGELSHLSADVSVIGRSNIGGVFGWVGGQVRYAYSQGNVSGTSQHTGGFAGTVDWDGEISDSFSTADVTGDSRVGGFAGRINISYGFSGSVHRVFSTGAVTGAEDVGGLIGRNHGTVTHSYWDTETSGQDESEGDSGVTGLTTSEMQQQATFAPFNFYSAWQIDEGNGYPEFQDFSMHALPEEIDLSELAGSGTEQDPYLINNSNELNAIRQDLEAHYKLNSDLDVTATVIWNHGRGWEPLGNQDNRFTGVFDGNGKTITGLATNRPRTNDQAFFGYADEAQITDLHMLHPQIYGYNYSGSLAGRAGNSSVSFITVTGNIVGTANYIGGIIGSASGGELSRLSADVSVIGRSRIGGVFGQIGGQVSYSQSQGSVYGTYWHTGGFAGFVEWNGEISNSFSTADVTGYTRVGGFAGRINISWGFSGLVQHVYSTGAVTGAEEVGGLIASNSGNVSRSYWNTETSGQETSDGGEGRTTEEMTYPLDEDTYVNWDFMTIWDVDEDQNMGYPFIHLREAEYALSIQINPENSGNATGEGYYEAGTPIDLTATPNTGYAFVNWTDEEEEVLTTSPTFVFTMPEANTTLKANFSINTYIITAQPNDEDFGSVTGEGTYEHFEEVTLMAIPETGCHFVEWTEDGEVVIDGDEPAGEVYSFIAEEERDLVAHFALQTFMVTFVVEDEDGQTINDATITLNGVENSPEDYVFEDLAPGEYSYLVEADGFFSEDGVLEVIDSDKTVEIIMETDDTSIDEEIPFELLVYPNPVTDKLFVESNVPVFRVTLIDLLGQIVHDASEQEDRSFQISVAGYPTGMYFLRVSSANQVKTIQIKVSR